MTISELELQVMAKEACTKYLDDGTPMSSHIAKLAEERNLNPHQVARICEKANLDAYNKMWDKTGSGNFTFEHADQDSVADELNKSPVSLLDEYSEGGDSILDFLPKDATVQKLNDKTQEMNDHISNLEEKTASVHNYKPAARKLLGRLGRYKNDVTTGIFECEFGIKEATAQIKDILKIAALRGDNIKFAFAAAVEELPAKLASVRRVFAEVVPELKMYGIEFDKMAEVFSEDAKGKKAKKDYVVHNQKAMIKHLKILTGLEDSAERLKQCKDYVSKKMEILENSIISTDLSKDVTNAN